MQGKLWQNYHIYFYFGGASSTFGRYWCETFTGNGGHSLSSKNGRHWMITWTLSCLLSYSNNMIKSLDQWACSNPNSKSYRLHNSGLSSVYMYIQCDIIIILTSNFCFCVFHPYILFYHDYSLFPPLSINCIVVVQSSSLYVWIPLYFVMFIILYFARF